MFKKGREQKDNALVVINNGYQGFASMFYKKILSIHTKLAYLEELQPAKQV
jgi:hypothetical protein